MQEMRNFIKEYRKNDELLLQKIIAVDKMANVQVSIATIKLVRQEMGWVCTRPHYCQLLREVCVFCCKIQSYATV